jgi:hypothetical protein
MAVLSIADEFNKLLKDRDYCYEVPKLGQRPYGAI